MLMAFGQFVFSLNTLAYQELQRRTAWKHASTSRVGARNGRQFTGPGDDTVTLTGWFMPDQLGGRTASLSDLRAMGDTGASFVLVDGTGRVYGAFVMEGLDEGHSLIGADGTGRRIEFTINLTQVDADSLAVAAMDEAKKKQAFSLKSIVPAQIVDGATKALGEVKAAVATAKAAAAEAGEIIAPIVNVAGKVQNTVMALKNTSAKDILLEAKNIAKNEVGL
jgi:phage protein U